MTLELKTEVLEQVKQQVAFGFTSKEDILEILLDSFYGETTLDESWLKQQIHEQFTVHQKINASLGPKTDFNRLVSAFDQLNSEKIVSLHKAGYTRQDAEGDCLEIIEELTNLDIKASGYCYYHEQDVESVLLSSGTLHIGYNSTDHNETATKTIANCILKVLVQNNFKVNWNGNVENRIEIEDFKWEKAYDGVDYNYDRVFNILENQHKPKAKTTLKNDKKPFWKFW
ncbi:DUF6891 domain-containing protein [Cellulophaga omnivescoria]|uniref:DUF6891 domain-containing protein n=1 Tax=Cellulophaga omnivescoria TaxID=1888890 RepID=UPI000987CD5E|nr:hypothetical protein [Cellulophaga omnivescoria]